MLRFCYYKLPNYYQRTLDSHRCIFQAICARDKARARKEMEEHLDWMLVFVREAEERGDPENDSEND